jgi:hypothetical protein
MQIINIFAQKLNSRVFLLRTLFELGVAQSAAQRQQAILSKIYASSFSSYFLPSALNAV